MENCIFCKIAKREIDTDFEKESTNLIVFKDIKPSAPVHLLIVPKEHIKDIRQVSTDLLNEIKETALLIAEEQSLDGFQLRVNYGKYQEIPHAHFHLLAKF